MCNYDLKRILSFLLSPLWAIFFTNTALAGSVENCIHLANESAKLDTKYKNLNTNKTDREILDACGITGIVTSGGNSDKFDKDVAGCFLLACGLSAKTENCLEKHNYVSALLKLSTLKKNEGCP